MASPFGNVPPRLKSVLFQGTGKAISFQAPGPHEVYVVPYPSPGGKHLVSTDGGLAPLWSRSGRELFYNVVRADGSHHVVVSITTSPRFRISTPRTMFRSGHDDTSVPRLSSTNPIGNYDVSADDGRFLHLSYFEHPDQRVTRLNVVTSWFQELERLAPTEN